MSRGAVEAQPHWRTPRASCLEAETTRTRTLPGPGACTCGGKVGSQETVQRVINRGSRGEFSI
eukprot:6871076-Pyramimonas_sp.AAC.1